MTYLKAGREAKGSSDREAGELFVDVVVVRFDTMHVKSCFQICCCFPVTRLPSESPHVPIVNGGGETVSVVDAPVTAHWVDA